MLNHKARTFSKFPKDSKIITPSHQGSTLYLRWNSISTAPWMAQIIGQDYSTKHSMSLDTNDLMPIHACGFSILKTEDIQLQLHTQTMLRVHHPQMKPNHRPSAKSSMNSRLPTMAAQ